MMEEEKECILTELRCGGSSIRLYDFMGDEIWLSCTGKGNPPYFVRVERQEWRSGEAYTVTCCGFEEAIDVAKDLALQILRKRGIPKSFKWDEKEGKYKVDDEE